MNMLSIPTPSKSFTSHAAIGLYALLFVAGCGGGGGGGSSSGSTGFSVGGTVSGLTGTGLVLNNNGGDALAIAANGSFTFVFKLSSGANYNVSVATQPSSPAQTCSVTNGSGSVAAANVSNVSVACVAAASSGLTEIPVGVTRPTLVQPLFTDVSFSPKFRVGAIYVSGNNGIGDLTSITKNLLAPVEDVIKLVATSGGPLSAHRVFALSERTFDVHVYEHDGASRTTTVLNSASQVIRDIQINRTQDRLLTLDESPTKSIPPKGARIDVFDTNTLNPVTSFNIGASDNLSAGENLCPCIAAADPNNFDVVYATSAGNDSVTAHRKASGGGGASGGKVAIPGPSGAPLSVGQIIADAAHAYVTDAVGRLHIVTPGAVSSTGTLSLSQALTGIVILGNLVRDPAPSSPYFFDVGLGPNPPGVGGSSIRVYNIGDSPGLVTTVPTATNAIGPLAFGDQEIVFWDGVTLKALTRGTWQLRTISGAPLEGVGNPIYYDDFTQTAYFASTTRDVVFALDASVP